MSAKILALVSSCDKCANYGYYSGGQYECRLVGQIVQDPANVAPFCPLADFPSDIIAGMETTIRAFQDQYRYGLSLTILRHVAAKLRVPLSPNGLSVELFLKSGEKIHLHGEYITEVSPLLGGEVRFKVAGDERIFKLHPDTTPPILYVSVLDTEVPNEEHPEGGLWRKLDLGK